MVDLDSSTRGAPADGAGGSGARLGAPQSALSLLADAEDILITSWRAFGAANPAVLELVEFQNPDKAGGLGGAGAAAGGGGVGGSGNILRR